MHKSLTSIEELNGTKWLAHPVDETKDNTLTIRLTGNSQNLHLGVPGPDGLQKQLVIEKKN